MSNILSTHQAFEITFDIVTGSGGLYPGSKVIGISEALKPYEDFVGADELKELLSGVLKCSVYDSGFDNWVEYVPGEGVEVGAKLIISNLAALGFRVFNLALEEHKNSGLDIVCPDYKLKELIK